MNQQNTSKAPELPVKRKRGRPRKDESVPRNDRPPTQPPLVLAPVPPPAAVIKTIQPPPPAIVVPVSNNMNKVDHSLVGQAVTCVIDGIFDNGYLLSTRMGPNNSILRGVVFQQGHVSPVTPENDVAPHVEMSIRSEFPIPPSNPRNQSQLCTPQSACAKQPAQAVAMQNYQTTPPMVTGGSSSTSASAPQERLKLVEQDDVMQVFEVSKTVEEPQDCDQNAENKHMVSDPTAESFHESDTMIQGMQMEHQNAPCDPPLDKPTEDEPVVHHASPDEPRVKETDGENLELTAPVETSMENQLSKANDELHQESKEQTGEVSSVDASQDPDRAVDVDLSQSNFPEI